MNTKELGVLGEKLAFDFLKNKGYKILDKNYSPKFVSGPQRGEIDIVAKKENVISFIEVKTLRQGLRLSSAECPQGKPLVSGGRTSAISPEERVDYWKQRKILKAAESWLMEKKIALDSPWQVDVVSIRIDSDSKKAKIRHFKNAACE